MTNTNSVQQYMESLWNDHDLSAVDQCFSDNVILHTSFGPRKGKQQLKTVCEDYLRAFPDIHVQRTHVVGQDDLVVVHWRSTASHQGVFRTLDPTGVSVEYTGITMHRLENGKIVEYWAYLDLKALESQLTPEPVCATT